MGLDKSARRGWWLNARIFLPNASQAYIGTELITKSIDYEK